MIATVTRSALVAVVFAGALAHPGPGRLDDPPPPAADSSKLGNNRRDKHQRKLCSFGSASHRRRMVETAHHRALNTRRIG
jgi:hypothetical protein